MKIIRNLVIEKSDHIFNSIYVYFVFLLLFSVDGFT
jgi:hypothetical protein